MAKVDDQMIAVSRGALHKWMEWQKTVMRTEHGLSANMANLVVKEAVRISGNSFGRDIDFDRSLIEKE